jgi:hypothetical protein
MDEATEATTTTTTTTTAAAAATATDNAASIGTANGVAAAAEASPSTGGGDGAAATKGKRGADSSWRTSKDEASDDSSDEGGRGIGTGEFQRADAETLSKRRWAFVECSSRAAVLGICICVV